MPIIKRVNPLSISKLQAVLFGLVGLILGILYSFGGLLIDILVSLDLLSASAMETPGLSWGTVLAFGALIAMPLILATIGFVLGFIEALLFNIFSKYFGGINLDL
jgi:hypothetical protein